MRYATLLTIWCGCAGLFPEVPYAPRSTVNSQSGGPQSGSTTASRETPKGGAASTTPSPPSAAPVGAGGPGRLAQWVGHYTFHDCQGESLSGDPMCWYYEVQVAPNEDGTVRGKLGVAGYQMEPYEVVVSVAPNAKYPDIALLLMFAEAGAESELPRDFKKGERLGVLVRRDGPKICLGLSEAFGGERKELCP